MTFAEVGAFLTQHVGWIVTLGLPGLGMVLKSYLDVKARNLANREDFEKLLEQQRKTTTALESIRSNIQHEVWLKQRRWEFRQETYGRVLAALFQRQAVDGMRLKKLRIALTRPMPKEESDYYERVEREQFEVLQEYYQLVTTALFSIGGDGKEILLTYLKNHMEETQTTVTPGNVEEHLERSQAITAKAFTKLLACAEKEFCSGSP